MNTIFWQRFEGAMLFFAGVLVVFSTTLPFPYWYVVAVFFLPDLSLVGYIMGKKTGAILYNCCHFYGLGAAVIAAGLLLGQQTVVITGVLLFAHCGFDRMLGYGLKETSDFRHTHLGIIGRK